jgi:NAD(P)H dehydrogenase (quinone)
VLEKFTQGLIDAGHVSEVVDLYAIRFNPVLTTRDFGNWLPDQNAPDVVEKVVNERIRSPRAGFTGRVLSHTLCG